MSSAETVAEIARTSARTRCIPRAGPDSLTVAATVLVVAALLAAIAGLACASDAAIERARHELLPTPTRGYFYPLIDPYAVPEDEPQFIELVQSVSPFDLEDKPEEVQELFEKIWDDTATQEEADLFSLLMWGEDGPPDPFADFVVRTVAGTVVEIDGDKVKVQPFPPEEDEDDEDENGDDEELESEDQTATAEAEALEPADATATAVAVEEARQVEFTLGKRTEYLVVSRLDPSAAESGAEVDVVAERTEDGIIRARTVSIVDVPEDSAFAPVEASGFGSGDFFFGDDFLPGEIVSSSDDDVVEEDVFFEPVSIVRIVGEAPVGNAVLGSTVAGIPASGRITEVVGNRLHIEAEQGPLRVTVDDESLAGYARQGSRSGVFLGSIVIVGINDEGVAVTVAIGPEALLNPDDERVDFPWLGGSGSGGSFSSFGGGGFFPGGGFGGAQFR